MCVCVCVRARAPPCTSGIHLREACELATYSLRPHALVAEGLRKLVLLASLYYRTAVAHLREPHELAVYASIRAALALPMQQQRQ